MYQVTLDQSAHQELQKRTHQRALAPRTRDRLEMVRLSDAGWSIPKIAVHLQFHEYTVRTWIKKYLDKGFDALEDQPHPGQPSAIGPEILAQRYWPRDIGPEILAQRYWPRDIGPEILAQRYWPRDIGPEILAQVHQWIEAGERTWNAPQVAQQVAEVFGIQRSRQQWCRLLGREGLTYKRTRRSLKHKQKPEQVASKRADLQTLQKGGPLG